MRFILGLMTVVALTACEEKYEKSTPFKAPEGKNSSADLAIDDEILYPTNPDAGQIIGKGTSLDPLESQKRKELNSIQPIVWGKSLAGIDTTTTYEQAKSILANPRASFVVDTFNVVIYPEYLQVYWRPDNNRPIAMFALEGYSGALSLPSPYDPITTKQDISSYVDTEENQNNFIRTLSREFQNEAADFDCIAERTCRFLRFDDGTKWLDFNNGRIEVLPGDKIGNIYALLPITFPARFIGDLDIENSSLGTFVLTGTRQGIENQLSGALDAVRSPLSYYRDQKFDEDLKAFTFYYDDLNIGIQWVDNAETEDSSDDNPESILVRSDFKGEIILKNEPDTRTKINESMLAFIDETVRPDPETIEDSDLIGTHAPQLMKDLDSLIYTRAVDYDCELEGTCILKVFTDRIEINLNTVTFVMERAAELKLQIAAIHQARFE